jgi:4-hydroxy-tetrahydrodipicolinate synthase
MRGSQSIARLAGSHVAIPTPFLETEISEDAFNQQIERLAKAGTSGIVVAGSTGEASTLSDPERITLFKLAVAKAAGRLKVIAGVGTSDTRTTLRMAKAAVDAGVDALMVVTPPYNRPHERGLDAHFAAVARVAPKTPIIIYNVPPRTGSDVSEELLLDLGDRFENIVAVKESSDRIERVKRLSEAGFDVLCGEDNLILEFLAAGAIGTVSVVGNIAPRITAELVKNGAAAPKAARSHALAARLAPLAKALSLDTNPVPVKAALAMESRFPELVRMPLVSLEDNVRAELEFALATFRAQTVGV